MRLTSSNQTVQSVSSILRSERMMAPMVAPAMSFWGAMRTIVIADAVMGLDNVLAVAGAAHGSVLLVILGLVISIPIVVMGSTLILHWLERFPGILYIGGAVLAWTSAKMLADEPLVSGFFDGHPALKAVLYAGVIGGVLGLAWLRNRRTAATQNAHKEAMQ